MRLRFAKMNGAGNDFILIDNRDLSIKLTADQVVRLCHRQRGVGADGLFLLIPRRGGEADWAWEFYNRDGSSADMCGNGARCFARYIQRVTSVVGGVSFETGAGLIRAEFDGPLVTVTLTAPRDLRLGEKLATSVGELTVHSMNTGVPHAVVFVPDADRVMVGSLGAEIRSHDHFGSRGTNVNFVQLAGGNAVRVRTFERGVEGETLACGTGVTASALVASRVHGLKSPVRVRVQGGDWLAVSFREEGERFGDVRLQGPADFVFDGEIEL